MQTVRFLIRAFMEFITSIFLGTVIGIVLGICFNSIHETGAFIFWRSLDIPVKFAQIGDATAYEISAISNEGKRYKFNIWDCQFNKNCNWVETRERHLYRDAETTTVRKDVCQHEEYTRPRYRPGNVVECIFTIQLVAEVSPLVYYAILDDGTIWYWSPQGFWDLPFLVISTLVGAAEGIVAGIIIVYRKEASSKYD